MTRILLIEDNADLVRGLRNNLEIEGYSVHDARTGPDGIARALAEPPDLVILDLMLPGCHGLHVLRELRRHRLSAPVLLLTALGEEADKVRGLRLGADDYLTKPFSLLELLARIEALLRRRGSGGGVIHLGALVIDSAARRVRVDGRDVRLTPKEYELLLVLAHEPGRVHSRSELLRRVWHHAGPVPSRTVDTHVGELRRKLGCPADAPRFIVTVRKAGYRLRGRDDTR